MLQSLKGAIIKKNIQIFVLLINDIWFRLDIFSLTKKAFTITKELRLVTPR